MRAERKTEITVVLDEEEVRLLRLVAGRNTTVASQVCDPDEDKRKKISDFLAQLYGVLTP
jgi:hypothetical protein